MAESVPVVAAAPVPPRRRRSLLGRIGFVALLIGWLSFLMLPFFLIVLAIQGEIGLAHGAYMPDHSAHPVLRFTLLNDPQNLANQGISITTSQISWGTATQLCVQTHVRFLMWEGRGDPASYCDCYTRATAEQAWVYAETTPGLCER